MIQCINASAAYQEMMYVPLKPFLFQLIPSEIQFLLRFGIF